MEKPFNSLNCVSVAFVILVMSCLSSSALAEPVNFDIEYHYPLSGQIGGVALSPDDQVLYVAYWDDTSADKIEWYDAVPPYSFRGSFQYGRCHRDCVVSADGQFVFFSTYYSNDLSRYDTVNGIQKTLGTTSWPASIAKTPDQSRVIVFGGMDGRTQNLNNDALCVYDIANGSFSHVTDIMLDDEPAGLKMVFSHDEAYGYFLTRTKWSSDPSKIYEVDMKNLSVTRVVPLPADDHAFGIALAGDTLYVSDSEYSLIRVFDRTTLTEIAQWPLQWTVAPTDYVTLAVPPDESGLYVVNPAGPYGGALTVLDLQTGAVLGEVEDLGLNTPMDIEFTSDSRKVFIPAYSKGGGGVVVLNRIEPEMDLLVYEEDFTSDPAWKTNLPSNYYWDPSQQAYHVKNVKDGTFGYFYTKTPMVQGSFRMEWDQKVTRADWASHLGLGFHGSIPDYPSSDQYARSLFQNPDGGMGLALHWKTGSVEGSDNLYRGFSLDQWYHFVLTHDATAKRLEARVYQGKGTGGPFWGSLVTTLAEPLPGLKEIGDSLKDTVNYGTTFEGWIDDVKIYVCAPFLTQSEIIGGQKAWFLTGGADSGEMVYFGYSFHGTEPGFDCSPLGGLHIDLNPPVGRLGKTRANSQGKALIQTLIPSGLAGFDIATQSAIYRSSGGKDSVKTNFVTTTILP